MSQPYAVVIVEDDWIHAQLLEDWLAAFGLFRLMGVFETCTAAYAALSGGMACDLLLLDMELQDMGGMQLLEMLKNRPFTIIQTSHPEFAVDAFRLAANDYLVKPFEKERFNQAILRFVAHVSPAVAAPQVPEHLLVKSGRDTVRITIADLVYIQSDQHYLHLVHGNARTLTLMTMAQLQPHLPEKQFMQVHRSYIINFKYFTKLTNITIWLGQHEVPLGATYKKSFEEFLASKTL